MARWPLRSGRNERWRLPLSLALVAGVETGVIVGALVLHWTPAETAPDAPAMTVVFSPPAEPAPSAPERVEPPLNAPPDEHPPPPAVEAPALADVPALAPLPAVQAPAPLRRTAPPRQHLRERPVPAEKPREEQGTAQAAPPASTLISAPVALPEPSAAATFDGLLRQAIQAAVRYPAAAQMMGLAGRARIAFDYRDGVVGAVRLERSAGSSVLDGAALAAVRGAHYPPPPQALAGRTLSRQLWVELDPGG